MLLYLNQTGFNLPDMLFQRDVSFYMFTLPSGDCPWLDDIGSCPDPAWLCHCQRLLSRRNAMNRTSLIHLSILVAALLLLFAWQYRISCPSIGHSEYGVVFGVGYTDANARLLLHPALCHHLDRRRGCDCSCRDAPWLAEHSGGLGFWLLANIRQVASTRFCADRVNPNELNLEREYIAANIDLHAKPTIWTRFRFSHTACRPSYCLFDRCGRNRAQRPSLGLSALLPTYRQVLEKKQFYEFTDIDIDR